MSLQEQIVALRQGLRLDRQSVEFYHGEGPVHRSWRSPNKLLTEYQGMKNAQELFMCVAGVVTCKFKIFSAPPRSCCSCAKVHLLSFSIFLFIHARSALFVRTASRELSFKSYPPNFVVFEALFLHFGCHFYAGSCFMRLGSQLPLRVI